MIDEIPIIGVTEWTVDGLAAKEFRRSGSPGTVWTEHRPSRVGKGRVGDQQLNFLISRYFKLEPVG